MRLPAHQALWILCLVSVGLACSSPALAHSSGYASADEPDITAKTNSPATLPPSETVEIPGPLRSFLRMAGISQEVTPEEVLPLLARNVALYGYSGGRIHADTLDTAHDHGAYYVQHYACAVDGDPAARRVHDRSNHDATQREL